MLVVSEEGRIRRVVEPLLALGGPSYHRFGTWLMVLGLYDLIFSLVGYAVFDFLLED